ncbi:MAG TPA: protein TolR [Thermodesulfobacteriota bacterium]|nr:protein TolR [Deltaproteobacteria bacterium]HNR13806.1 protein TolR [Thermodesulfobacteriota bacterium]HNU72192.1 protein TolR [Thermodesulfobacteriota bacterium]HOC39536.1 protein TolR [Thermodesulfobacteriota bacterium]
MQVQNNDRRLLSDINVTPFVDVMLVLLIIFMVTAPMMQAGFEVDLPQVNAAAIDTEEQPLILSISKDQLIKIQTFEVTLDRLAPKLKLIYENRRDKEIFLKADKEVPYGFVMAVMGEVREAGFEKLGMITQPLEKET